MGALTRDLGDSNFWQFSRQLGLRVVYVELKDFLEYVGKKIQ